MGDTARTGEGDAIAEAEGDTDEPLPALLLSICEICFLRLRHSRERCSSACSVRWHACLAASSSAVSLEMRDVNVSIAISDERSFSGTSIIGEEARGEKPRISDSPLR